MDDGTTDQSVDGAIKFLSHPDIKHLPLSERVKFLEAKGLSFQQIDRALKIVEAGGVGSETSQRSPPESSLSKVFSDTTADIAAGRLNSGAAAVPAAAALTMATSLAPRTMGARNGSPLERALRTTGSLVMLGGLAYLAYRYIFGPNHHQQQQLAAPEEAVQEENRVQTRQELEETAMESGKISNQLSDLIHAVEAQTKQLQTVVEHLRDSAEKDVQNRFVSEEVERKLSANSVAELKAEVSSLKALVMALSTSKGIFPVTNGAVDNESAPPLTPEQNGSSHLEEAAEQQAPPEENPVDRLRTAMATIFEKNPQKAVQEAIPTLQMYARNLTREPDNPRYRRIPTVNANFKTKVASLEGYEELLTALGFSRSASYFEWTATSAGDNSSDFSLLNGAVRCLADFKQGKSIAECLRGLEGQTESPTSSSLVPKADVPAPSLAKAAPSGSPQREKGNGLKGPSTLAPASEISGFDDFLSRLKPQDLSGKKGEQKDEQGPTPQNDQSKTDEAPEQLGATPTRSVKALTPEAAEANAESISSNEEATPQPQYPSSFLDVMNMVRDGKSVPGIKTIPNKLSEDALTPTQPKLPSRPKPWETLIEQKMGASSAGSDKEEGSSSSSDLVEEQPKPSSPSKAKQIERPRSPRRIVSTDKRRQDGHEHDMPPGLS